MIRFDYTDNFMKLFSDGKVVKPARQTKLSAGYDVYTPLEESITVKAGETITLDLGIKLQLDGEHNKVLEVYPRSSLAKKKGLIFVSEIPKFIAGKEAQVTFLNYTDSDVTIEPNERLVQIIIADLGNFQPACGSKFEPVSNFPGVSKPMVNQFFQFQSVGESTISSRKVNYVSTGIKAEIPEDCYLTLELNEQIPTIYPVTLANTVGVVDADYYNNKDNEGHIMFAFLNVGYTDISIPAGLRLGYGTVKKYFTLSEESSVDKERESGFGSTTV